MGILNGINVDGAIIKDTLGGIGGLFRDIRNAITGKLDPGKEADLNMKLQEMEAQAANAQIEVNKIEAQNPNILVSGWRPCVGWLCCLGLAYKFFMYPILTWASDNFNIISPPDIDVSALITLLLSLLGMIVTRTTEKMKGVSKG